MSKVVLVASVKGGTGKTLFSINLAHELASRGYRVYLLDADITSSYFKYFTNAEEKPVIRDNEIRFAKWNGINVFSMSLMETGPMSVYGFSERQIISDVHKYGDWNEADILIIDLPAGAEDVYKEVLRLWSKDIAGQIIVMIPFAWRSAVQILELAGYYGVPVLGLVENMSYVDCAGEKIHVFGKPMGQEIASKYNVPFFGAIPLDPRIQEGIDKGDPILPKDLMDPVRRAADAVEKAEPGVFEKSWRKRVKRVVRNELIRLIAQGIIVLNRSFDIGGLRRRFGFKGGRPFSLVIVDEEDKPIAIINLKLKEDRIVVVKGNVKPDWLVEVPVNTLVDIMRGYRESNGRKLPFDVRTAWSIGELRIYGAASTNMLFKVLDTIFSNEEIMSEARKRFEKLAKLMG